MKTTFIRVLTTVGTVLFVALSGWTTVSAAKMTGRYIASHLVPGAATDTSTPTVTPTMTGTPMLNGTHQPGDDDHDEYLMSVPTGTPHMEEDDDYDDDFMVVPGTTATPSMSSTSGSNHSDDEEHNYNNGGGDEEGGDD